MNECIIIKRQRSVSFKKKTCKIVLFDKFLVAEEHRIFFLFLIFFSFYHFHFLFLLDMFKHPSNRRDEQLIKLMQKKKNSKHDIHLTNVIFFASKKEKNNFNESDKRTIFNTQIIYIRNKHPDDFFCV